MRQETISITCLEFPPLVLRGQNVLILLRDSTGRYILGSKKMYPEGICRLLGGGVEADENIDRAAARELEEETGLGVTAQAIIKLGAVTSHHTNQRDQKATFISHVYFHDCGSAQLKPTDDVDELCFLTQEEYEALIVRFANLPMTIDKQVGFAWGDYGKLQSYIHQFALDEVMAKKL